MSDNKIWWKRDFYWGRDMREINFGNLPDLPEGYGVCWSGRTESYLALGRQENMEVSFCDRFDAYNQAKAWSKPPTQ